MPAAKIILYSDAFWISPWVFSAHVALREKGAAFEVREVGLQNGDQKREGYQAATLTGRTESGLG